MIKFRAPFNRLHNPFVRGLLYGIGWSGALVNVVVSVYNMVHSFALRSIAVLIVSLLVIAVLSAQAFRIARSEMIPNPPKVD